jgi:hypothetical protein
VRFCLVFLSFFKHVPGQYFKLASTTPLLFAFHLSFTSTIPILLGPPLSATYEKLKFCSSTIPTSVRITDKYQSSSWIYSMITYTVTNIFNYAISVTGKNVTNIALTSMSKCHFLSSPACRLWFSHMMHDMLNEWRYWPWVQIDEQRNIAVIQEHK